MNGKYLGGKCWILENESKILFQKYNSVLAPPWGVASTLEYRLDWGYLFYSIYQGLEFITEVAILWTHFKDSPKLNNKKYKF